MKKLKNIKIAFIDIDGTLSNSKKEVTKETIESIKYATKHGMYVVLCSGRTNSYVCEISKKIHASSFVISCNGAETYNYETNQNVFDNKIAIDDINTIWKYCQTNNIGCILNTQDQRYCNEAIYDNYSNKILLKGIQSFNIDTYQIVTGQKNYDKMSQLEKFIGENNNLKITNASSAYIEKIQNGNHYFFDITNKNVNKGIAIKQLLEYLKLGKENAIGFGDHINDHDLFESVGFKIAMANANPKLKEQADFITLSNDENGVAHFLNNFIDYN